MAKKKKAQFNPKIKALFEELKRDTGTTSKEIAEALGVSQQTVTNMSSTLCDVKVRDMIAIARCMGIAPGGLLNSIMAIEISLKYEQ